MRFYAVFYRVLLFRQFFKMDLRNGDELFFNSLIFYFVNTFLIKSDFSIEFLILLVLQIFIDIGAINMLGIFNWEQLSFTYVNAIDYHFQM